MHTFQRSMLSLKPDQVDIGSRKHGNKPRVMITRRSRTMKGMPITAAGRNAICRLFPTPCAKLARGLVQGARVQKLWHSCCHLFVYLFPSLAFCNLKRDSLRLGRDYLRCPWRRFSFCVLFVGVPLGQIFSQRPHSSCMVTRKSCFVLSFNRPRGMFSTPRLWTILEALEGFSDC